MADPIHQFEIQKLATLGHIGGHEIAFTNSALFMAITVVGIWALLMGGSSARALVPGRQVEAGSSSKSDPSALARGFRLSTELVAGVLVGAFIGWALDKWLGISPWGMIVFLLLGFAAGVVNVMRAAGVSSGPGPGSQ